MTPATRPFSVILAALAMTCACLSPAMLAAETIVDFEDLAFPPGQDFENGANLSGEFQSGGLAFNNSFTDWGGGWTSWFDWAYSRTADMTTAGYLNQYSVYSQAYKSGTSGGPGAGGSRTYGVACLSEYDLLFGGTLPTIRVPEGQYVQSAQIANTTYAYLAMANGDDGNTPPFVTGPFSAGDFLKVIVKGYDQQHAAIGSVAYYLADFRPADQRPDNGLKDNYILSDWTDLGTLQPLDNAGQPTGLGALAGARTLEFLIDTSDRDHATGFANTPLYFALDNITVAPLPEPSTIVLIASGAIAMCFWRRRRTSKR